MLPPPGIPVRSTWRIAFPISLGSCTSAAAPAPERAARQAANTGSTNAQRSSETSTGTEAWTSVLQAPGRAAGLVRCPAGPGLWGRPRGAGDARAPVTWSEFAPWGWAGASLLPGITRTS
ncbi:hypothetical protein SNE510_71070 [Streptomyces sp. NE5-10]|nr:hypothetical protein SNE510_71070 [Streptomyces sp. NE5-10]